MTIGEMIQRYGVEFTGRFYSVYKGVVTNNQDPDFTGQLTITLPSVLEGVEVVARPRGNLGGMKYGAKAFTPRVGEIVWVEFEMGDPMRPVWSPFGWAIGEVPEEFKDNDTIGIITPNGNKVYLKEDGDLLKVHIKQKVEIEIEDGTQIYMDKDKVEVNGGLNKQVMNIEYFKTFVEAVQKDLLVVMSGQNVSQWMATDLPKLPDDKFTH